MTPSHTPPSSPLLDPNQPDPHPRSFILTVDLRRHVRGRELRADARRARRALHGQRGPKHQRLPVLHVHGRHALAGREARRLWLHRGVCVCGLCCFDGLTNYEGRRAIRSTPTHTNARTHTHVCDVCEQEGMDVLKQIEAVGSQTGATSQPVMIQDCTFVDRFDWYWYGAPSAIVHSFTYTHRFSHHRRRAQVRGERFRDQRWNDNRVLQRLDGPVF